ncbi:MAG: hypothetical protein M1830_000089 [Pleopsidium flavum]|nr:MAG: hypothetical protein M1830_000089 [Pleopsidium flavum]
MATHNPMEKTYTVPPAFVSRKTFSIAGIITTVYGLGELPSRIKDVTCLWLLHPRLQTQACMEPIAASTIIDWNRRLQESTAGGVQASPGLIAVSFDQRNHGSREVDKLSNEAWRSGNAKHAQDMFSIYHGTAIDTSHLLTYLSSYTFPHAEHTITSNIVLGISLGGHAAWHCVLHDPRIIAAIIVIGCPDYVRLMSDRARLSKLQTWTNSVPPGSQFLGSKDFPKGLVEAVEKWDPAALLMRELSSVTGNDGPHEPSEEEKRRLVPLMKCCLQGKRILNLAGGADKLVPYKCAEPFLTWLKRAIAEDGLFKDSGVLLEDIIFEGVGHEMSEGMVKEVLRFVQDTLAPVDVDRDGRESGSKSSKM